MLYDNVYSYFFWIGTVYLLILTWQDYKRNMLVDDRHNYFMMGLALSLISHFKVSLWYILFLIVFITIITVFIKKSKALGTADIHTFIWIFWGLGYISVFTLAQFLIVLITFTTIYSIFKFIVFKYTKETPFYYVILASFFVFALYFGYY